MTITRHKHQKPDKIEEKRTISAEEFILAVEDDRKETVDQTDISVIPYIPIKTTKQRAMYVMESFLPWAAASGIMPIPALDLAVILAVQLRMLAKIGNVYGVQFKEQAAKSAITALMASSLQQTLALNLISGVKFIPIIGSLANITVMPALAVAGTYAIGKVFITHFETGGTFLNFEASKSQYLFSEELKAASKRTS